jgi:hypothetical protein
MEIEKKIISIVGEDIGKKVLEKMRKDVSFFLSDIREDSIIEKKDVEKMLYSFGLANLGSCMEAHNLALEDLFKKIKNADNTNNISAQELLDKIKKREVKFK